MSISTFHFSLHIATIRQFKNTTIYLNSFSIWLETLPRQRPIILISTIIVPSPRIHITTSTNLNMPSGFPNFRQIPSNLEVVMANRRAALQSKTDTTKDTTKDATDYDSQSMASTDTLVSKSKSTKSSQGFSSGWKRMWLLSQERVVSALYPGD